jgi:hypothetical protein
MALTDAQKAQIDALWNAGEAPNGIAAKIGGTTPQEVRAYLRTVDLERPTRPASPTPPDGA